MLKTYYALTKPGIVYGNALSAIAAFFLASHGHFDLKLFSYMVIGICLVMAAACVLNNYLDRDIDSLMTRTKKRALVSGEISPNQAFSFGTCLLIFGVLLLLLGTNPLTTLLAILGFIGYVFLYTYAKRLTVHGTLLGSLSGAIPPMVGYCAVSNRLDLTAVLLFIILMAWQMPHFYAIAMFRSKDYAQASLPVLPLVKGFAVTKRHSMGYVILFLIATIALTIFGSTGGTYLLCMLGLDLAWLKIALNSFHTKDDAAWARQMFRFSLLVLLGFCFIISVNAFLP